MFPFGLPDLLRWQRNRHTGTLRTMADDEDTREGTSRSRLPSVASLARLPHLPTPVATALTGLVCGLVATALVWGGERGCDAARGRPPAAATAS